MSALSDQDRQQRVNSCLFGYGLFIKIGEEKMDDLHNDSSALI